MKHFHSISCFVCLGLMLFFGCKKDHTTEQPALGYNYFPLIVGKALIYQVDSIGFKGYTYDPTTQTVDIDSVHYQIKEVVDGFFTDNAGRQTATISRYKRQNANDPWLIYKVFAANLTTTTAERLEDNIRYIKLVFPTRNNTKWNGNSYNNSEPLLYELFDVNTQSAIGSLDFDLTLTVLQNYDSNLLYFKNYFEKYASGTGMIYKEYNDYDYMFIGSTKPKNGFIYKETLISL